jgi:hypothetical protein
MNHAPNCLDLIPSDCAMFRKLRFVFFAADKALSLSLTGSVPRVVSLYSTRPWDFPEDFFFRMIGHLPTRLDDITSVRDACGDSGDFQALLDCSWFVASDFFVCCLGSLTC